MTARTAPSCRVDHGLPGCDSGPVGRLGFVLGEARAARRSRRDRATTNRTPAPDDRPDALPAADGRPDLPLGGTR